MSILTEEQKARANEFMKNEDLDSMIYYLLQHVSKDDYSEEQKEYFECGFVKGLISALEITSYFVNEISKKRRNQ